MPINRSIGPGSVFGKWTVRERIPGSQWICVCECGATGTVKTGNLSQGLSTCCRDCGWRKPRQLRRKLGLSQRIFDKLSRAARNSIRRCTSPDYPQWHDYGGRGISVYEPWEKDYKEFVTYLATLPGHDDPGLELDRIDNDGGYRPGNLRFVTRSVSMQNRRCSKSRHCLTVDGN